MLAYKYYDTPEGQDIFKKVFVTSKYAALTGLAVGTFDVLMYSHPKGIFNTLYRYSYIMGPLVGMAAAFTVTANSAQNIREKNDAFNYFLGGAVAGAIFGATQKSIKIGLPASLVLGVAAMIKKEAVDANVTLVPEIKTATKTIKSVNHDWSLVKDIEELKTWKTGSN